MGLTYAEVDVEAAQAEAAEAATSEAAPVGTSAAAQPAAQPEAAELTEAAEAPEREPAVAEAVEAVATETRRFPFEFSPRLALLAAPFGVTPSRAYVEVTESELSIRFGLWSLRTPLANIKDVRATGPYQWWKVAGPAHISVADGGITFATTTAGGVCVLFHESVPAALPTSLLRHPSATVTVATPHALIDTIQERR